MASQSLRLRRALTSLSTVHRSLSSPIIPTSYPRLFENPISPSPFARSPEISLFQTRTFTGSRISLSSAGKKQYRVYKEGDELTEDMVLFEGCDFNHWLITVDFPKDPKPTPEEMVATYERICAQGLGISIEEAKKKIYACSTTTYQGFQALMTEEESEKFKDIPGVVFVLPDSYIDPQNKEYGGDKYENGIITPRPPPVQYRKGGRFNDRNRNPPQTRYDQQGGPMPNQRGSPQYSQQGYIQGGENYGPPRNYPPQQNYGPPGQGDRMPMNNREHVPGGRGAYQANTVPYQGSFSHGQQGGYPQDQRRGQYQGNYQVQQGNHYPQDQRGFQHTGTNGQVSNTGYEQGSSTGYGQGSNAGYGQGSTAGGYGQGSNGGYGQGSNAADYGQGSNAGYGQDSNTGYRQGYMNEGQRFSHMGQRNMQGEQANYAPSGQPGTNQGILAAMIR
ncbi:hypothetical protein JCGZ_04970 [Jatropha curcas]|uniref:MORF/ORRM1/DAG-like MORF domain-containing protein n=1 Tax=Jatropha curcas TaxID=180498 RepID=A0A067KV27_JATCU|nr:hypothetical protein JCGZ_04970 [Jatropha curcas]